MTNKVDLRKKSSMIDYLSNHSSHYDRRSGRGFSHNIKIYNLGLDSVLMDKAWKFLNIEHSDFWDFYYEDLKQDLKEDTGYSCFVDGRCGGHIVFEMTRFVDDELDEMSVRELRRYTKNVLRFDEFYEDLKAEFIHYLKTHNFVEEECTVIKKVWEEVEIDGEEAIMEYPTKCKGTRIVAKEA